MKKIGEKGMVEGEDKWKTRGEERMLKERIKWKGIEKERKM